eukprot:174225_1
MADTQFAQPPGMGDMNEHENRRSSRRRSRSPRRRRRSPSYSRSRSRERRPRRKKKKSLWDQAPSALATGDTGALAGFTPGIQVQLPDGTTADMGQVMGRNNPVPAQAANRAALAALAAGNPTDLMHVTRQARRLYFGNLPFGATQDELKLFLNQTMETAQGPSRDPGDAILSVYINHQRRFAFVEFRTMEEATQSMALDGLMYCGESLKVGRPANYNPALLPPETQKRLQQTGKLNTGNLGIISNQVPDGPNKIFCGGLPYELADDQVKELLTTYGPLKAFHMVKDTQTGMSKGFCFFEYQSGTVTEDAVTGLHGIQIGDRTLTVRRHSAQNQKQALGAGFENMGIPDVQALADASAVPEQPTTVLCLLQMVTEADLLDMNEYREILEDVQSECTNYGVVRSLEIPRPSSTGQTIPGTGKVFVEFDTVDQANAAKQALEGRTFDNRTVLVKFMDLEKYRQRQFD